MDDDSERIGSDALMIYSVWSTRKFWKNPANILEVMFNIWADALHAFKNYRKAKHPSSKERMCLDDGRGLATFPLTLITGIHPNFSFSLQTF